MLANLADCYERTGKLASALRTFERAQTVANQSGRPLDAAEAARRKDDLSPRVPRVSIHVDREAPETVVTWDGAVVPRAAWNQPTPVDAGTHTLVVRAPGYESWEAPVLVASRDAAAPLDVPPLRPQSQDVTSSAPPPRQKSASAPGVDEESPPIFWLEGSLGLGTSDTESLSYAGGVSGQSNSPGGPVFAAGAGVHLGAIRAGLLLRNLGFSGFNALEWGGEVAVQGRADRFVVYLGIRGGYAKVSSGSAPGKTSPGSGAAAAPGDGADGFDVGLMVGLDYYLARAISIGVEANPELLDIHRAPLALPAGVTVAMLPPEVQALQSESGLVVGAVFVGTVHVGVHF